MSIDFIRYHAAPGEEHLTAQLVECYRDVFADRPWNEWLKCHVCNKYWGLKDASMIAAAGYRHCDQELIDFWPRSKVDADINAEIRQDRASCWLALDGPRVIGFCWGYPTNGPEFNVKIGLDVDYSKIGIHDPHNTVMALQDEVGVLYQYRGQKIAKQLVALRNRDFLQMGLKFGVVRTKEKPEPSVTYLWYRKLGYEILARYHESDGRVIMGIDLSYLV